MLEILEFIYFHEDKILKFIAHFNNLVAMGLDRIKTSYPFDNLLYLEKAYDDLNKIKHILLKQKHYEKRLVKFDKKLIRDLKIEAR